MGRPKKVAATFAGAWGLTFMGLQFVYRTNPQKFYQQFLFTPWSPLFFGVLPIAAAVIYWRA